MAGACFSPFITKIKTAGYKNDDRKKNNISLLIIIAVIIILVLIGLFFYFNNINKEKVKLSNVLSFKEKIEILMYSIKQVESHGRYKAKSKWSSACGAYQYMPITWNNYQGFKTACLAPESVQDSRMRGEIKYLWTKYHDWEKVIASHFLPAYADNKALWNKRYYAGQPTIREYVQNVQTTMNTVVLQLATT